MVETLLRFIGALMALLRGVSGAMLITSVAINFVNIIGRYFFSAAIPWAEETMLFLMIGCVFSAAGPVGYLGRHIRMDVVVLALPPAARKPFEIFADLVTIATCIMLSLFAVPVVSMLVELDERSSTANIPLVIPQAVLPLGLVLMALLTAARLALRGRGPGPGPHDPAPRQDTGH